MSRKKTDLAIVNRSFWPQGQVIGEGLLQFAEKVAQRHSVCVITQSDEDLAALLKKSGRAQGVQVRACKAYTTSGSGVIKRVAEAVFFMFWTFYSLVRARPANVYVSTNPPVVVPFIVALYCWLFSARYVYHLQDIHPEGVNTVIPVNGMLFRLLVFLDNYTLRNAHGVITLSEDMAAYIRERSSTPKPVFLLDNPSFEVVSVPLNERTGDIIFCGNAGRLQRIPLIIGAIREYLRLGGQLRFTFAGGGIYGPEITELADSSERVDYRGVVPPIEAADLVSRHLWALLPIDDEVTRYAFPSKSSGYVLSGAGILAVCGLGTSVAKWIEEHGAGMVCTPEHDALVRCFFELEKQTNECFEVSEALKARLTVPFFSEQLQRIVFGDPPPSIHVLKAKRGAGR